MQIVSIEPFILHVPIEQKIISDSTNTISHWGVVGAKVVTDTGLEGFGYAGTHAEIVSDKAIVGIIGGALGPELIGENPLEVNRLWHKMYHHAPLRWVGRAGIVHLAIGALDIALWDIKAKAAEQPLWQHLGGATSDELEAYNTDVGWLSNPTEQLIENAKTAIEEDGYRRLKLKVGQADPMADVARIEAVRKAVGPHIPLAVDANGKWDLPTAIRFCRQAEALDIFWLEEPLWFDDLENHVRLVEATRIPIALGEQLYSAETFAQYMQRGAMHYAQPDVTRVAGITEYLRVADAAYAHRMPVAAHVGDMGQIHVHLAFYHGMTTMLEYIPWIARCFEDPIRVSNGFYQRPQIPGAGTTLLPTALESFGVSLS
ncbi:MAG: mandelate racemase/muconate lactonizing enzyme family protein [Hyphomicrobiales bacterium]|nr:mandelate racemase/muconate lactonizing enzyme family protein [Hyphomicrobiales bacterium]